MGKWRFPFRTTAGRECHTTTTQSSALLICTRASSISAASGGLHGVETLAPISDVVVIVLSFTTCVDIATANGAVVFPYRVRNEAAGDFARARSALLAGPRGTGVRYSLSPAGLLDIPAGVRLVLPSPNGSTLSLATGATPTLAGCLRNSGAVAAYASRLGRRIAVIPCGERWSDDSLRPAVEDLSGAGAVISRLAGHTSPEAQTARTVSKPPATTLGGSSRSVHPASS